MAFTQNALVRAGKYTCHNQRKCVTLNDIKNALKVETFKFLETDNSKAISDWKEYLENTNNQEDEDDCDEHYDEDDCDEDYDEDVEMDEEGNAIGEDDSIKVCQCECCLEFNTIDEKWNAWVPEEGIPQLLKDHIENRF